jgi:uncharacterized protein (DUF58 family)
MAEPEPGRPPRSRVARLSRRGWSLGVVGVSAILVAYVTGRPEFLVGGLLLLLLPVLAFLWVRFRRVSLIASRTFLPEVVEVQAETRVRLVVENLASGASPVGYWRDTWPWPPFVTAPSAFPLISGRAAYGRDAAAEQFDYRLRPTRRGVFEVGPLIVDFGDPFGLADSAVTAVGSNRVVVTPAVVELAEGALSLAIDEGPTRMPTRRSFGGDDDTMTREYRRGDAMRRVHWRATAHHGELMVRQEEQRDHAEARIVLETRRSAYRDARGSGTVDQAESEAFEWSVGFVASLSSHLAQRGFQVGLAETGRPQLASIEQPEEFRLSLAEVQLTDQPDAQFSVLRRGARADRRQGSIFAVLSESDDELIDRLARRRTSFDLAVAFVVHPRTPRQMATLSRAGWVCVRVEPQDGVQEAWVAAGAEQESARAGT